MGDMVRRCNVLLAQSSGSRAAGRDDVAGAPASRLSGAHTAETAGLAPQSAHDAHQHTPALSAGISARCYAAEDLGHGDGRAAPEGGRAGSRRPESPAFATKWARRADHTREKRLDPAQRAA